MTKMTARFRKSMVALPDPVERAIALPRPAPAWLNPDEAKLFALTFVGGFVFTSLFIA